MKTIVSVDKAGRVVIPKLVRDRLSLNEGSQLTLELSGDRIELRPQSETARIARKGKLRIVLGGNAFHGGAAILADREQRLAHLAPRRKMGKR